MMLRSWCRFVPHRQHLSANYVLMNCFIILTVILSIPIVDGFRIGGVGVLTKRLITAVTFTQTFVKKTGRDGDDDNDLSDGYSPSQKRSSKGIRRPIQSQTMSQTPQVSSFPRRQDKEQISLTPQQLSKRRAPRVLPPDTVPPPLSLSTTVTTTTTRQSDFVNHSTVNTSQQKIITTSPRNPTSLGEAIQFANTPNDLLDLCFQLPTENNSNSNVLFPSGDRYRYQRWSAQLLLKLGNVWPTHHFHNDDYCNNKENVWRDERLVRAVIVVAAGFDDYNQQEKSATTKTAKSDLVDQVRSAQWALQGLATLAGKVPIPFTNTNGSTTDSNDSFIHKDILHGIRHLIQQAETFATLQGSAACELHQIVEMRWASRGLLVRLGGLRMLFPKAEHGVDGKNRMQPAHQALDDLLPKMQHRVQHLPFDIIPSGVEGWSPSTRSSSSKAIDEIMNRLLQDIPFAFDQILTRQGTLITERRGTAWVTEAGIGPMAYSGKVMQAHSPLPPSITTVMRTVESVVGMEPHFLDCALCNWYPHDEAAMKYHCDPDHGTLWDRCAVVVAIGDPRRFAFRPNTNTNLSWQVWDKSTTHVPAAEESKNNSINTAAVIHLFSGDIVHMWGACNDDFQHAVLQGNSPSDGNQSDDTSRGRISIVMKHAMVREPQK